ncbi:MAG: rhodanese-related sulfurtransferase [Burkholderiales bacterium]|nr:rhodanese-related sulfurtransferase [Burkholderiales bacterium]
MDTQTNKQDLTQTIIGTGNKKIRKEKLYNQLRNEELKAVLDQENIARTTISFYQYFHIQDPQTLRDNMYKKLHELKVFGRIYLAGEGINAQISVPTANLTHFRDYLYQIPELNNLRLNTAVNDNGKSFWVLKIKIRQKIVADGIVDPTFDMHKRGQYVNAEEFNQLTNDPNTVVVDMRNHYEYEVGHFENAVEIPSDTFREQLPLVVAMLQDKKEHNIIMYCTGGIRCEKASAWMRHNGFTNIFHLEGGIINYANTVNQKGLVNKFRGKNFVFDNRLGEQIGDEIIANCHQCGKPADNHVNCANQGCHLLFIQCSQCNEKFENCCSPKCQEIIHLPLEQQKNLRKGVTKGSNIFNKSKIRSLMNKNES